VASVPSLAFALNRTRDNQNMTRRRWIADDFTPTTARLTGSQAEHLARVLRAQPGTQAEVVADGFVYEATIASVSAEEVVFDLGKQVVADAALPIALLLAVFKFDRMEWAIEKATELGIASIAPILASRTEKHLAQSAAKRAERWRRIAQEAAQQSRRSEAPTVEDPATLAGRLANSTATHRILLAENERDTSLRQCILNALNSPPAPTHRFAMAIGPEGGWTNEEFALFEKHGWQFASLGPRILRAETAAIASLAILGALISDH
jgi:16S rRNA (uracil1498-N3)-methyltransferase